MLSVAQLLERRIELIDSEVSVQGVFLHDGTRALLMCDPSDSADSGIIVEHSDLLKKLFSVAPAFGGGNYLYKDNAEMTGIFRDMGSYFILDSLTGMKINCDGEEIRVI